MTLLEPTLISAINDIPGNKCALGDKPVSVESINST